MYGKLFERMYTGSMMGSGAMMFAVWPYVISHMKPNRERTVFTVELNTSLMAVLIGENEEDIKETIQKCCEPDPMSRTPDEEGRKLIKKGSFEYEVVNGAVYDRIKRAEDQRESNRMRQAKHYQKTKDEVEKNAHEAPVKTRQVEFPENLKGERFKSAWEEWVQHRKEIRKPLKETASNKQLKVLSEIGEARAISAIERSIAAGWMSINEGNGQLSKPTTGHVSAC